ncbi:MAG: hypothetical protein AMS18_06220 [Gemmatimonas sp. SG8_17]|nr:MAG: hypothetical protein AMS18_06220 [Gemmatimonas sp. SG8_17]
MTRISLKCFWLATLVWLSVWGLSACDSSGGLFPASVPNVIDTVTLYALRGTPLTVPSAFDIIYGESARTEKGEVFDFAFDIDSAGNPLILPAGVLGLAPEAGILPSEESFEAIDRAPDRDYTVDSTFTVSTGDVFIARSRNSSVLCTYLGSLPRYGKFHVLALDAQERSVTLEFLVNSNCGFRSLEPGIPTS